MFVALLDLIPVIGSSVAGAVVSLVALTVSLPVALATLAFYIGYRLAEDYLIVPRIMGRTVQVPAIVSLVAVLIGGVLLGIVGALVAIPWSPRPSGCCCTRSRSAAWTEAELRACRPAGGAAPR